MLVKSLILSIIIFLTTLLVIGTSHCEDTAVNLKNSIGIWEPDLPEKGYSTVIEFSGNKSFRMAWSIEKLETRPVDRGSFKLEGKKLHLFRQKALPVKIILANII